jgi:hypothetical protein
MGTEITTIPKIFYSGVGAHADRPAATGLAEGSLYTETDTYDICQVQSGAWVVIFDYSAVGAAHASGHIPGGADPLRWTASKLLLGGGAGADPTEVDPYSRLIIAQTEVYNGSPPTSWTDLNLAGTIGANSALVMLKLGPGSAARTVAFRKNGDTDEHYKVCSTYGIGTCLSDCQTDAYIVFLVPTDASGIVEWMMEASAVSVTLDVIAYIK